MKAFQVDLKEFLRELCVLPWHRPPGQVYGEEGVAVATFLQGTH